MGEHFGRMVRRLFPRLTGWLRGLPDRRDREACDYSTAALAWTGVLMYAGRLGSRRQIKYLLGTARARERLGGLCGEEVPAVPHGDTVDRYLVTVDPAALQTVPQQMVRALLKVAHMLSRMFECYCRGKKVVKHTFGSLRNLARAFLECFRRDPLPDPETLRRFLDEPIQVRLKPSRGSASNDTS